MSARKKSLVPATVLSRFLARCIDLSFILIPFVLIVVVFFINLSNFLIRMDTPADTLANNPEALTPVISGPIVFFIVLLLISAYFAIQMYYLTTRGQSLGKMALGIRIANKVTGDSQGFIQNVFLREVLNSLLCMIPLYFLVDCAFILQDDRRCIHDHIAGTVVVKA